MKKPTGLAGWQSTPSGSKDRDEIPLHCFIGPHRTYPVKVWRDGKWEYSKQMLKAAISRANSQNRPDISKKASRLLKEHFD